MPVRREAESPTPPSSRSDISNATTPPKRPRAKKDTSSPVSESKPSASPKRARSSSASSSMTPEIKEALVDHLMRVACSAVQKDQLAAELGITKKQLDNAICSGRVNLRSKLVKAARDM